MHIHTRARGGRLESCKPAHQQLVPKDLLDSRLLTAKHPDARNRAQRPPR